MQAITDRFGPSHLAFLVVPMVGAFFIDIVNAIVIKLYLLLPIFPAVTGDSSVMLRVAYTLVILAHTSYFLM